MYKQIATNTYDERTIHTYRAICQRERRDLDNRFKNILFPFFLVIQYSAACPLLVTGHAQWSVASAKKEEMKEKGWEGRGDKEGGRRKKGENEGEEAEG